MTEAIDITTEQRKLILGLLKQHLPGTVAWVYGSRVKWTARPQSDLDMVVFSTPEQRLQVSDLRDAFEESNLPFRVDLFVWDDIPDNFKKNIQAEYVVLAEKVEPSASDWSEVTIGEVAEVVGGGTPSSRVEEYWGGSIAWLTPKDLSGYPYRRIRKGARNITDIGLKKSGARLLPPDTVLITCRAPIGYVAIAEGELTTNQGFRSLILKKGYDPEFFYYWVKQNVPELEAASSGTTFKEISGSTLKQIKIRVPTYPEQRAMARILGSLDDKIEHNRQMSETLEAMAQALFKSWFIDFDPVIDNALSAGNPIPAELKGRAQRRKSLGTTRKPLPANIHNLFPSEFHPTQEAGWIPKGWEIKPAHEIANIAIGKTPPRKEEQWFSEDAQGNEVWVSIKDMGGVCVYIDDSSRYLTPAAVERFNIRKIPAQSVLVSFKLTIGRVAITQTQLTTNEAIAHFVGLEYGVSPEYLYCYLKSFDYAALGSTSSIATAVNSKIVKAMPVLLPPKDVLRCFVKMTSEQFSKIDMLMRHTKSLSTIRDALLPELLAGKLRISSLRELSGE